MKKLLYLSILILAACTKPANNITAPASIVMTYPQSLDSLGLVADKWYSLGDTSKAILFASDMTVKQVHTVNSKKDTAIFYCSLENRSPASKPYNQMSLKWHSYYTKTTITGIICNADDSTFLVVQNPGPALLNRYSGVKYSIYQ